MFCGELFDEFEQVKPIKGRKRRDESKLPLTHSYKEGGQDGKNERRVYRVGEINSLVKEILEENFSEVWVEGEISNSTLHSSGHFYFSLKDETGLLKAVMFNQLL